MGALAFDDDDVIGALALNDDVIRVWAHYNDMRASTHGSCMGALVHDNVIANSWLQVGLYTKPWVPVHVLCGPLSSLHVH